MPISSTDSRLKIEQRVAALAARQHGVVTRAQLVHAGISPDGVDRRLAAGRLRSLARAVYAVGPFVPPRAREMAAVLACGSGAVVSHRSSAAAWQILPERARALVEVIVTRGHPRPRGVRVHRVRVLYADEVTKRDRIPLTTPARTLFDLACSAPQRDLERALAQALSQGLTTAARVRELLARHPRRRGTDRLRRLLAEGAHPVLTRSEAEDRFLELVRHVNLADPEVNAPVHGFEVDFIWRAEGLVVEIDGFAFHSSSTAFETDRRRDAVIAAAGLRVMRVTWRQMVDEPAAVMVRVAQALARS